jgi:hypothetical protein
VLLEGVRDVWKWLDEPFEPPPQPIAGLPTQLVIRW